MASNFYPGSFEKTFPKQNEQIICKIGSIKDGMKSCF